MQLKARVSGAAWRQDIHGLSSSVWPQWANFQRLVVIVIVGDSASWQAASCSDDQEIPRPSWNLKFIIVFIRGRHWILSWTGWIYTTPSHPFKIDFNIILLFTPMPPSWSLSFRFEAKMLWARLHRASYTSHPPWFDQPINVWRRVLQLHHNLSTFCLRSKYSSQHCASCCV
jgi:hypothetical protein